MTKKDKTPLLVYTMHLDADKQGEDKVAKYPFYSPAQLEPYAFWESLPSAQKDHIMERMERDALSQIWKGGKDNGVPYQCRICQKPAADVARGPKSVTAVQGDAVYVTRNIVIPICSAALDCPCGVRAMQLVACHLRNKEGVLGFDRHQRCCFHCGKVELREKRHKQCARCKVAYYCTKECQLSDWKAGHKKACTPWDDPNEENSE